MATWIVQCCWRRTEPGREHHTGRGSEYASGDERYAVGATCVVCSMSRKCNRWESEPVERRFSTIIVEEHRHFELNTRKENHDDILRYDCR